jgi:hypothetical protein
MPPLRVSMGRLRGMPRGPCERPARCAGPVFRPAEAGYAASFAASCRST